MSPPVTIFDSGAHATLDDDYEVQIAKDDDGNIVGVAFIDMELGRMVEFPPEVALMAVEAIQNMVRPQTQMN